MNRRPASASEEMSTARQTSSATSVVAWTMRAIMHLVGTLLVAGLLLWPVTNRLTATAMWESAQHSEFVAMSWSEAALHLGLSACIWALIVIGYQIVTAQRQPVRKLLDLRTGSVLTETLVILPIFFLLTFGIAQLALNNMAGLVANTAVFQAGRTAWLWSAEAQANRRGVTMRDVREKARVQAAAVLAPVAPGDFTQLPGAQSQEFSNMRAILLGGQMPAFSQDTGRLARSAAPGLLSGDAMNKQSGSDSSFIRAFDVSSWRQRTVRKFTFAYHATRIEVSASEANVRTDLTYFHHQAMPLVGGIFGDNRTPNIGGRTANYAPIERSFSMSAQLPPNPALP